MHRFSQSKSVYTGASLLILAAMSGPARAYCPSGPMMSFCLQQQEQIQQQQREQQREQIQQQQREQALERQREMQQQQQQERAAEMQRQQQERAAEIQRQQQERAAEERRQQQRQVQRPEYRPQQVQRPVDVDRRQRPVPSQAGVASVPSSQIHPGNQQIRSAAIGAGLSQVRPPSASPFHEGGNTSVSGGGTYMYHGRNLDRVSASPPPLPHGVRYKQYVVGEHLAHRILEALYVVDNWLQYGLNDPPQGDEWVSYGPDVLLVDSDTGEVVDAAYTVFADDPVVADTDDQEPVVVPISTVSTGHRHHWKHHHHRIHHTTS